MPKVLASSGTIGTTRSPNPGSRIRSRSIPVKTIVVETSRPLLPSKKVSNGAVGGAANGRTQYVELVDTARLQPPEKLASGMEVLAAVAVYFGETRLIDNTFVRVP